MEILGANPHARAKPQGRAGTVNYLIGRDRSQWRRNVPAYDAVGYAGVYPGIDLRYHGGDGALEYDFEVAPGADPSAIRLRFPEAQRIELTADGDLLLHTSDGDLTQRRPLLYQPGSASRRDVEGQFRLLDAKTAAFAVGAYDRSRRLIIDPLLEFDSQFHGDSLTVAANGNLKALTRQGYASTLPVTTSDPKHAVVLVPMK